MKIAVYAGTFDPVTLGHVSVIERAARLFDALWVVVAVNPNKQPLFSPDERLAMLAESVARWPNVHCAGTAGYVVELARSKGARYLVRGVRSATDADAELALANMNRALAPEIETVFVPADPRLSEVSSSRLKALAREGADLDQICPPHVAARLRARLGEAASRTETEVADV
jgi:pantetheine-phosphate adenylyltransferase